VNQSSSPYTGTVAECHFDCNFHISAKIVSKFENFVPKAHSATVPSSLPHYKIEIYGII